MLENLSGELKREFDILSWPDEFSDPTPNTNFGDQLASVFESVITAGGRVTVAMNWAYLSCSIGTRSIGFSRRGRIGPGRIPSWEVQPRDGSNFLPLGPLFGRNKSTCIVITEFSDLQRLVELWLGGESLSILAKCATFWDRYDPTEPLSLGEQVKGV